MMSTDTTSNTLGSFVDDLMRMSDDRRRQIRRLIENDSSDIDSMEVAESQEDQEDFASDSGEEALDMLLTDDELAAIDAIPDDFEIEDIDAIRVSIDDLDGGIVDSQATQDAHIASVLDDDDDIDETESDASDDFVIDNEDSADDFAEFEIEDDSDADEMIFAADGIAGDADADSDGKDNGECGCAPNKGRDVFVDIDLPESVNAIIDAHANIEELPDDDEIDWIKGCNKKDGDDHEPADAMEAMLIDVDDIADSIEEKKVLEGDGGAIPLSAMEVVAEKGDVADLERELYRKASDAFDSDESHDGSRFPGKPHIVRESGVGDSENIVNDAPAPIMTSDGQLYMSDLVLQPHVDTPSDPAGMDPHGSFYSQNIFTTSSQQGAVDVSRGGLAKGRDRKHNVAPRSTSSKHRSPESGGKLSNVSAIYDAKGIEIKLGDLMAYGSCYDLLGEVVGIGHNCFFTVHLEDGPDGPTYVADQWILDGTADNGGNFYHYVEDSLELIIDDVMDESISLEELAGRFREVSKRMRAQKGISHQQYLRSLNNEG